MGEGSYPSGEKQSVYSTAPGRLGQKIFAVILLHMIYMFYNSVMWTARLRILFIMMMAGVGAAILFGRIISRRFRVFFFFLKTLPSLWVI